MAAGVRAAKRDEPVEQRVHLAERRVLEPLGGVPRRARARVTGLVGDEHPHASRPEATHGRQRAVSSSPRRGGAPACRIMPRSRAATQPQAACICAHAPRRATRGTYQEAPLQLEERSSKYLKLS